MRNDIRELGHVLRDRGVEAADVNMLREHARRVAHGAAVARALNGQEHAVARASMERLYQKYPQQRDRYPDCESKTVRDMKLVLRYCAYSIALDDPEYAKQRMFYWLRTIFNAFQFGNGFIEDAYRLVQANATAGLEPDLAAPVERSLDEVIEILCH